MRTTKPISTISFNTAPFLKLKLNELLKAGRISFWAFITHKPEDDEGGKKEHHHVYIEPAKMLQSDDIRAQLTEIDLDNLDKPRKCITFRASKFDPWYMYGLHDKRYLASISQSRRFHYSHEDFITSDSDDFLFKARSIDMLSLSPYADMMEAQSLGITWDEYFSRGVVPIAQISNYQKAWMCLQEASTNRNGRPGHIDEDTGEVVDCE